MNNIKTYMLTLVFMLLGSLSAMAGNVVSIQGFDIVAGETKDLSIVLENTDPVSVLQIEFVLPKGLKVNEYEGDKFQKVGRATRHSLDMTEKKGKNGEEAYMLLLTSASMREMAPGNAAIISFEVTATSDFVPVGEIMMEKVIGSNKTNTNIIDNEANEVVLNEKAHLVLSATPVSAKVGEVSTITVSLENQLKIGQMQANITLPEGLEIVLDEDEFLYTPTSRTQNHEVDGVELEGNKYTLLITTNDPNRYIKGTEGAIFTFTVKATQAISDAVITISDVHCSDLDANNIKVKAIEIPVEIEAAVPVFDLDGDNKININDVQMVLDAIIAEEYVKEYDLEADGKLNINDVQVLLDYIIENAE